MRPRARLYAVARLHFGVIFNAVIYADAIIDYGHWPSHYILAKRHLQLDIGETSCAVSHFFFFAFNSHQHCTPPNDRTIAVRVNKFIYTIWSRGRANGRSVSEDFVFFVFLFYNTRDSIWMLPFLAFFLLVCIRRILRYYFILMMSSSSLQIASENGDAMWMSTKRVGHGQESCNWAEWRRNGADVSSLLFVLHK